MTNVMPVARAAARSAAWWLGVLTLGFLTEHRRWIVDWYEATHCSGLWVNAIGSSTSATLVRAVLIDLIVDSSDVIHCAFEIGTSPGVGNAWWARPRRTTSRGAFFLIWGMGDV